LIFRKECDELHIVGVDKYGNEIFRGRWYGSGGTNGSRVWATTTESMLQQIKSSMEPLKFKIELFGRIYWKQVVLEHMVHEKRMMKYK